MKILLNVLPLFFATTLLAQEAILLPLVAASQPGAHGSQWTTELWAYNQGFATMWLDPAIDCGVPTCVPASLRPLEAEQLHLSGMPPNLPPGRLLYAYGINEIDPEDLVLNLRVRDESRAGQSMGVQIPVVRRSELFTSSLVLLNIPGDARFRHTLRIYDPSNQPATFRLRLRHGDAILSEQMVTTTVNEETFGMAGRGPWAPSAAQLDLRAIIPAEEKRYHLTIEPLQPSSYWAFLSITNNGTQEVTIITPQ